MGECKLFSNIVKCLEFFHNMNVDDKVMSFFPTFSFDRSLLFSVYPVLDPPRVYVLKVQERSTPVPYNGRAV